jgi:hypothetical protein
MLIRFVLALLFIPAQIVAILTGAGRGAHILFVEFRDLWREAGRKS